MFCREYCWTYIEKVSDVLLPEAIEDFFYLECKVFQNYNYFSGNI